MKLICMSNNHMYETKHQESGAPLAIMNVEEEMERKWKKNRTKKKSLIAV